MLVGGCMKKVNIKEDIIMIIIISFVGFFIENMWMLYRHLIIDNRNMFLPFLLGYGLFIIVLYYLIGTPKDLHNKYSIDIKSSCLMYLVICFTLVSIGEILLGTFVEKTGHFYYWNYSSIPLHMTRYTSIPTSIGFAIIITLFMNYIYEPLNNYVKSISKKLPTFLVIIVFTILLLDMNISFKNMYMNKGQNLLWSIDFKK